MKGFTKNQFRRVARLEKSRADIFEVGENRGFPLGVKVYRRDGLDLTVNGLVFAFSVGILSYPALYGYAALGLMLVGLLLFTLRCRARVRLELAMHEKIFIGLISMFVFWQVMGIFFQPEQFRLNSLDERLTAFDYSSRWILLIPAYFLFRQYRIDWRVIAVGLSIGCLLSVSVAHYQVFEQGATRAWGVSSHTISFAELMVVTDFFLWVLMVRAWSEGRRLLSLILLVASLLAFYGSLLSVTRGAWLAYFFAMLIWLFYLFADGMRVGLKILSGPVLFRFSLGVVLFLLVSQTSQFETIAERSNQTVQAVAQSNFVDASGRRLEIWTAALDSFLRYPLGVGTENFSKIGTGFSHAHNELINIAVENGFQGVLSFLALIGFVLMVFLRTARSVDPDVRLYSALGIALLSSYAVFSQTQALLSHHDTLLFFILYLYLCVGQCSRSRLQPNPSLFHGRRRDE